MQTDKNNTVIGMLIDTLISKSCRLAALLLVITLTACETAPRQSEYLDAAEAPLNDLNLVRAGIPAILVEAEKDPYAIPYDQSCENIEANIHDLDITLGIDQGKSAPEQSYYERGKSEVLSEANSQAVGFIRSTTESILPFRSWIRRLSGAERHKKAVGRAIAAGTIRRAFLKGMRISEQCPLVIPQQPFSRIPFNTATARIAP